MARYKLIYRDGKVIPEHRAVWEEVNGRPVPHGCEIHHINGNSKDNSPDNLMLLTRSEHRLLHAKLRRENRDVVDDTDPDVIASRLKLKLWYHSNKEYVRDKVEEWRAKNPDKHHAQSARWNAAHPDKLKESAKKYLAKHKDLCNARRNLRNAIKRGSSQEKIDELRAKYISALQRDAVINGTAE